MTTRILPSSEWARLAHTDLAPVLATAHPDAVTVVVAETPDGTIAGCWALITFVHLEGLWIHPAHQGMRAGVILRRMWNAICGAGRARQIGAVFTGAATDQIAAWIRAHEGAEVPFASFVLPLKPLGRM